MRFGVFVIVLSYLLFSTSLAAPTGTSVDDTLSPSTSDTGDGTSSNTTPDSSDATTPDTSDTTTPDTPDVTTPDTSATTPDTSATTPDTSATTPDTSDTTAPNTSDTTTPDTSDNSTPNLVSTTSNTIALGGGGCGLPICGGETSFYDFGPGDEFSCTSIKNRSSYKDKIVALPARFMKQKYCGHTLTLSWNGHTTTAIVGDTCPDSSCNSGNNRIDLSRATYLALGGSLDAGILKNVHWSLS